MDRGWSWVILFAVFCSNVIIGTQYCSVSIFYTTFLQVFQESRTFTSWFASLNTIFLFGCGPLASHLLSKIGIRNVLFIASACATVAYIIMSVSTSLIVMILAYGILGGIGFGFALTGGVAAIALYFDQRLFIASSIGLIGIGIGTVTYGPLLEWLIRIYGWRGASLLFSGISLQFFIVSSTVFPAPSSSLTRKLHRMELTRRNPNSCDKCKKVSNEENFEEVAAKLQQSSAVLEDSSEDECRHPVLQQRSLSLTKEQEISRMVRTATETLSTVERLSDVKFWCLAYVAFTWGFCAQPFIAIQKDVISSAGLSEHFQLAVVVSGISNTVSRILICFLTFNNVLFSFFFVLFLGGISVCAYAAVTDYWTLVIISLLSGLYLGASFAMLPMCAGSIYGRQEMAATYGYLLFFVGMSCLGGPSLVGYLRDVTGVYNVSLYLIGAVQMTGAVVAGFLHFRMKYCSNVK